MSCFTSSTKQSTSILCFGYTSIQHKRELLAAILSRQGSEINKLSLFSFQSFKPFQGWKKSQECLYLRTFRQCLPILEKAPGRGVYTYERVHVF